MPHSHDTPSLTIGELMFLPHVTEECSLQRHGCRIAMITLQLLLSVHVHSCLVHCKRKKKNIANAIPFSAFPSPSPSPRSWEPLHCRYCMHYERTAVGFPLSFFALTWFSGHVLRLRYTKQPS